MQILVLAHHGVLFPPQRRDISEINDNDSPEI
jgi:hypothetical protein